MRVLLANSTCKVGGVSTFMLNLHGELLALGHECELFFFERGTMEPFLPPAARVHFGTLSACMRLIARRGFDVVHANNVDWSTGVSAVRQAGATLILTAHKARESAWTYGWRRGNCDRLVAVSRGVQQALQPYTDIPVDVVHNGIDMAHFMPAGRSAPAPWGPPIVAWVGRSASPVKRLDAFSALAPTLHGAGCRIWVLDQHGIERGRQAYPDSVARLQPLAERWMRATSEEMPSLYRAIAASGGCVVCTSEREGLGLSLIEAQACGCVAAGPDVGGVNEAIRPEHGGLLYPPDLPPAQVATLILSVLNDPQASRDRADRAATFAQRTFSLRQMATRYLELYRTPATPHASLSVARFLTRWRLSPLLHWRRYMDQRWGVGQRQHLASTELLASAEPHLAAAAAREALHTSPTLYLNRRRLGHLIRTL